MSLSWCPLNALDGRRLKRYSSPPVQENANPRWFFSAYFVPAFRVISLVTFPLNGCTSRSICSRKRSMSFSSSSSSTLLDSVVVISRASASRAYSSRVSTETPPPPPPPVVVVVVVALNLFACTAARSVVAAKKTMMMMLHIVIANSI